MSGVKDKVELSKDLKKIALEKKILAAIPAYYNKVGRFDHKIGVSELEFKNFLLDAGFEEIRENFLKEIDKKIKARLNELSKLTRTKADKKKAMEELETKKYLEERKTAEKIVLGGEDLTQEEWGSLKQIIFIPSWSKLIGTEKFNGFYLGQPVYEIIHDNVIFLPDFAVTGFEETKGEPFIFLSGVGLYYTQFRLSPGEIIDDQREITGIILPMDVYDRAQDMSRSLVKSAENLLMMTEVMITIPFSIFESEQTKQMYLRGIISRNVYHPYKECFTKMYEICKSKDSFLEENGLKVLSGGLNSEIPLYTNEILTEEKLGPDYSRLTAGLKNIQPKLDKIITDLQIIGLKEPIFENIQIIKKDFSEKGWPRLLDWMP